VEPRRLDGDREARADCQCGLSPSFYIMFTAALSIIALAFVWHRRYPRGNIGFGASAIIGGGGAAVSTPTSSQLLGRLSPRAWGRTRWWSKGDSNRWSPL